jgi:arabinan endo-1,5-alpha-L-arabinosidase
MMGHVRRIVWCPASLEEPDNLWPIVLPERYAAVPDYGVITKDTLVGRWEHINLQYSPKNQNTSTILNLNVDGTMSGALSGTWSYDENKKLLRLGDVMVCVERELDWEANPRIPTIVYAGTGKNLNATYWGKKVE